jgi:glycosyltransferase involved in cell wall biosynthesis
MRKSISEVKQAYMGQLEISRSIEAAIAIAERGDPDHADVIETGAWAACTPQVSVIVPLFDQGRYLRDAIGSVVAAIEGGLAVEIVIVDDHSDDDSRSVAERLLAEMDWLPMALHARAANGGLARARNHALRASRAPFVFTLDADDMIYPTALWRLYETVRAAPPDVVAAYGIVESFDATGSVGLISQLDWDVDLLVRERYLDGMAMYKRQALVDVGGWQPVTELQGWEDYDLWLTFAERRQRAAIVRSVIARSRHHPGSLRELAAIDTETSFVTVRERHPRLPWPS